MAQGGRERVGRRRRCSAGRVELMRGLAVVVTVILATVAATATPAAAETVRQQQWHLDAINAPKAQRVAQGNGVTVAEIDTGVDASHPDLAGAVLPGVAMLGSTSARGLT